MSKCQQWISVWMIMMLTFLLLVTGVGHTEAQPVMDSVASDLAHHADRVAYSVEVKKVSTAAEKVRFALEPYVLYKKGADLAEIHRENQEIMEQKQEFRRLAVQHEADRRIMLASRDVELAEFAQYQRVRLGEKVAASAVIYVGKPYVWGGTTPQGFDCSGFTQYVLTSNGIKIPRNSYDQFEIGQTVQKNQLQPGDLVFFSTYAPGPSHLGIYVGDGKFVHALNHNTGVITSKLDTDYYKVHFIGARRVL